MMIESQKYTLPFDLYEYEVGGGMKWNASSMRWEKRGLVGVYVFVLTGLLSIYLFGRVCDCIRWHLPPFDGERNCINIQQSSMQTNVIAV